MNKYTTTKEREQEEGKDFFPSSSSSRNEFKTNSRSTCVRRKIEGRVREVTRHICHSLDGHVEFSRLMLPSVARYGRYSSLFTRYSILKFRSEKRLSMKGGGRISLLTSTSFNNRSLSAAGMAVEQSINTIRTTSRNMAIRSDDIFRSCVTKKTKQTVSSIRIN